MTKYAPAPRRKPVFAVFALVSIAVLAAAVAVQFLKNQPPCALCVLQRAGFLLFALIALAAAIQRPRERGAVVYSAALSLAALAGLSVALRHIWVLYHPKFGCGIDALQQMVNEFPTAKLLPWLFHASGECTQRHDPLLGLQIPEWSAIWFGLLLVAAIYFAFRYSSASRGDGAP